MFFGVFVESGVDGFVLFIADRVGDLHTKGLSWVKEALDVEIAFGEGDIRVVSSGEVDIVSSGDVSFDC